MLPKKESPPLLLNITYYSYGIIRTVQSVFSNTRKMSDNLKKLTKIFLKYDDEVEISDADFGKQRLEGIGQLLLKKCKSAPPELARSVDNLYEISYDMLKDLKPVNGNYINAVDVYFEFMSDGKLMPVMIRNKGICYFPGDVEWKLAKLFAQNCDFLFSDIYHGGIHFISYNMTIFIKRNIGGTHPIHVLMHNHLLHSIAIGNIAVSSLLGNLYNAALFFFGSTDKSAFAVLNDVITLTDLNKTFADDINERGISALPTRYNTYGKMYYGVINKYVTSIVDNTYKHEEFDTELLDFKSEAGIFFPKFNFKTKKQLINCLISMIFHFSFVHTTLHRWQYKFFGNASVSPPQIFRDLPPKNKFNKKQFGDYYKESLPPAYLYWYSIMHFYYTDVVVLDIKDVRSGIYKDKNDNKNLEKFKSDLANIRDPDPVAISIDM